MAKFKIRERAVLLRKEGKSYSEIKSLLKVSKSTLSLWLRDYPLSDKKIRELRDWNQKRIENYRETRRKNRENLLRGVYNHEKNNILPFSRRELFLAGLFLYWGEGGKTQLFSLSVSNNDPAMVRFFISWFKNLGVSKKDLHIRLHLYEDMVIKKEVMFWSDVLDIPTSQFKKSYIKKSRFKNLTYKSFGHGTCNVIVNSGVLAKKVLMGLQVIRDCFSL